MRHCFIAIFLMKRCIRTQLRHFDHYKCIEEDIMDYEHLNLEHFFARNDDLDIIRDRSEFVMINNMTKEMMYRDGDVEGTINLARYYYKNRSQAASFIMMDYHREEK